MFEMLEMTLFFTILVGAWALGDIISTTTRSYISMIFVGLTIFLVGFWLDLIPVDIAEKAGLAALGSLSLSLIITHMGTLLNIKQLKEQWKTVVVTFSGLVGVVIIMLAVARWIIGYHLALASIPAIAGSLVAAIIMGEAALRIGVPEIATFVVLLVALQGFVGIPLTSICLNREAKRKLKEPDFLKTVNPAAKENNTGLTKRVEATRERFVLPALPDVLQTPLILLLKVSLLALLAIWIGTVTQFYVHPYILCLLFGIFARRIGYLEENVLSRANAFGFLLFAALALVPGLLREATPEVVVGMVLPLFVSLLLGTASLATFGAIAGKLVGFSVEMGVALALTAMYGFPGTYILAHEVSRSCGAKKEESSALLEYILPKILVAGFITVTLASVFIAALVASII